MSFETRIVVLAAVLCLAVGAISFFAATPFGSDDQNANITGLTAASSTASAITELGQRIEADSSNPDLHTNLGNLYLLEARETGDPGSYARAEQAFQQTLGLRPGDSEALIGLSSVASGRHEFETALSFAQQAPADDADTQAVLGDALIELGRYEEAFAAYDQVAELRPDVAAYTRIAYARELTGEVDGAVEAMSLAVDAAGTAGETAAWTRLQLGHLYFNQGDLPAATEQYEQSLTALGGYSHASAGLARVNAANGDYAKAAELYEGVVARQPVLEYVIALGDVYQASGRDDKAAAQFELVAAIQKLYQSNGVSTDLELALFRADHGDSAEALNLAQAAYNGRPSIHAADALAWALYSQGSYEEALRYSDEALRLGTRDATLLYHAGMIHDRLGNTTEARDRLQSAIAINPAFSLLHSEMALDTLERLEAAVSGE